VLKHRENYDTYSSRADEAKQTITFFKHLASCIYEKLEQMKKLLKKKNPSITIIMESTPESEPASLSESSHVLNLESSLITNYKHEFI
jgi:hypothetical protein